MLVGYGPAVETGARAKRKPRKVTAPLERRAGETVAANTHTMSTPPVRKLAHNLGVDLTRVAGTGADGMITREDVLAAMASGEVVEHATATEVVPPIPPPAERPASGFEAARAAQRSAPARPNSIGAASAAQPGAGAGERRIPIKGVRKATAAAMVASAFSAPHVTVFLTVDVTRTLELVAMLKERGEAASMLAVVARALCLAVARNPSVNSHWDEPAGEIVEYDAVNLGIAVATPRGLMVPNIRDAHALSLGALTDAIGYLARTARDGATSPEAFSGGTITISNVGVFGVDAGTPILNPGEAAILAIGAVRKMPWEHRGELALRDVMTLSLSFDHRLGGRRAGRALPRGHRSGAHRARDGAGVLTRTYEVSAAQAIRSRMRPVAAPRPLCGVELSRPNVAWARTRSAAASSSRWMRCSTPTHSSTYSRCNLRTSCRSASVSESRSRSCTRMVSAFSSAKRVWAAMRASQCVSSVGMLAHRGLATVVQACAHVDEHRAEHGLLAVEVPVDRGTADAGGGAELLHRDTVEPSIGEEPGGGGEQRGATVGLREAACGGVGHGVSLDTSVNER